MTKIAIACGIAGVILMIGFEYTVTRVLGVAALFAFIVCGVFAIAEPEVLAREDGES
jgi:ABC-type glucose/galactose transport system permease subunit